MKSLFVFLSVALLAALAPAARPLEPGEFVLYVSSASDSGSIPPGFLLTTGVRVVDLSAPETLEWAAENGLPGSAPSYPAVYLAEAGDFETEFQLGRSGMMLKQAKRGHAKRNASKAARLKSAEDKLAKFLASEGAELEPGMPVSRSELARVMSIWDTLNDAQANAKYARYDRLLKPVLANGGSEYDVFKAE